MAEKIKLETLSDVFDLGPDAFRELISELPNVYETLQVVAAFAGEKPSKCFPGYIHFSPDGKGTQTVRFVNPDNKRPAGGDNAQ